MTAKHLLDQIVRGLDGVTAWLPKRRWEQMTAAEPWLTNIVYSEDQGKFFDCVPLYSAEYVRELEARATAAEATVKALQEKLAAQKVAIKPLEWEYVERKTMTYTAFWADGDVAYYIDQSFGSDSYYFRTIRWPEETIYDGDDLPSAKAAAQSDYESRIRSALASQAGVKFERLGNINLDVVEQLQAGYSWTTRIAVGEWHPQSVQLYIKDGASAPALPERKGGDKGDGWQPIETAPSAHEAPDLKVLVFNPRWVAPIELRAADGDWWRSPVIRGSSGIPTHWRHLPAAPSASIEGETNQRGGRIADTIADFSVENHERKENPSFVPVPNTGTLVPAVELAIAQNEWLKDRLADLQLPANSHKNIEEWLAECGMPTSGKETGQ